MLERDITLADGRTVHVYDTGDAGRPVVQWHHGSGMRGTPPGPLVELARALGVRIVAHDRPGYGTSTPRSGRSVADGALDALAVLDAFEIPSAGMLGLSAGAMHALACAALAPERVTAAVSLCGPAPWGISGLDWFAGMSDANVAEFEAGLAGRTALTAFLGREQEVDLSTFAPADLAAMHGPYWDWQLSTAERGSPDGSMDDLLASLGDWGVTLDRMTPPTLLVHGAEDTFVPVAHARRLADAIPLTTLRIVPGGHISTIPRCEDALEWLLAAADERRPGAPA